MKKVLVVNFSQSGQLADIASRITTPLQTTELALHIETLVPQQAFPFPWPFVDFIDAFPECVLREAPPLKPLSLPADSDFDLIILCYQVWYLAPALPMTAFLQSTEGKQLIKGKPVITVVACRNMWLSAQQAMQEMIAEAGGRLLDHIAFTDHGHPLATFITTPRWVLTGRRNAFLGLPAAGVAPDEIASADRFGKAISQALKRGDEQGNAPLLRGMRAVTVNPRLAISERAGRRAFGVWSRLIRTAGKRGQWRRRPLLLIFLIYLIAMIITVVPLSLLLQWLFAPLLSSRLNSLKAELELPSGSDDFNLEKYAS